MRVDTGDGIAGAALLPEVLVEIEGGEGGSAGLGIVNAVDVRRRPGHGGFTIAVACIVATSGWVKYGTPSPERKPNVTALIWITVVCLLMIAIRVSTLLR